MAGPAEPQFGVEGSYSGEVLLEYPLRDGLPPFIQVGRLLRTLTHERHVKCAPGQAAPFSLGFYSRQAATHTPPLQAPTTPQPDGQLAAQWLRDTHLTLELKGAGGDVSQTGLARVIQRAHQAIFLCNAEDWCRLATCVFEETVQ